MKTKLMPGIGAYVNEGRLGTAIRTWKTELTDSGKIQKLRDIKSGFVKPSKKRRDIIELAKYKETFRV